MNRNEQTLFRMNWNHSTWVAMDEIEPKWTKKDLKMNRNKSEFDEQKSYQMNQNELK